MDIVLGLYFATLILEPLLNYYFVHYSHLHYTILASSQFWKFGTSQVLKELKDTNS